MKLMALRSSNILAVTQIGQQRILHASDALQLHCHRMFGLGLGGAGTRDRRVLKHLFMLPDLEDTP